MSTPMDKIRDILVDVWDPLFIGENPNLRDEYDSYIPSIYKSLMDGISIQELTGLLVSFERKFGEEDVSVEDCKRAAAALKKIVF